MALLLLFLLFALVHSTTTADIGLLDRVFKGDYNRLVAPAGRHGRTRVVMTLSEAWSLTDVVCSTTGKCFGGKHKKLGFLQDDRGQVVSFRGSFFMARDEGWLSLSTKCSKLHATLRRNAGHTNWDTAGDIGTKAVAHPVHFSRGLKLVLGGRRKLYSRFVRGAITTFSKSSIRISIAEGG